MVHFFRTYALKMQFYQSAMGDVTKGNDATSMPSSMWQIVSISFQLSIRVNS